LGFLFRPTALPAHRCLWIQALSVGEVTVGKVLIERVKQAFPKLPVFLTTTTVTGFQTARRILPETAIGYFPFDLPFSLSLFLKRVKPCLFISLETEFWPNLLRKLARKGVLTLLINGRFSPRSYRRYKKVRFLLSPVISQFFRVGMRSEREAKWMNNLGFPREKILVTGNMKYDVVFSQTEGVTPEDARKEFLFNSRSIVFGSLHPEEEELAVKISRRLVSEFPDLKVIFAPRHLERSKLEAIFKKSGLRYQKFSSRKEPFNENFLILDKMGYLNKAYAVTTAAFVGGSLTIFGDGGHNLTEPAAYKKPVAFGPHAWNFKEEGKLLMKTRGGFLVKNFEELYTFFRKALSEPQWSTSAGERAYWAIREQTGATDQSLKIIKSALAQSVIE